MKQVARTVANFALRVFVAVGIFCVALEILAFAIVFCLLGYFSEIARPVSLLSAFIFIVGAVVMMAGSVWIVVAPSAFEEASEKPNIPLETGATFNCRTSRVERIISGFIGSLGGCMAGFLSFLFFWASYGRLDLAFVAFHAVLLAFTFLAYAYPAIVPEISLNVIDSVAKFLASFSG
jgi:hypothetical protein